MNCSWFSSQMTVFREEDSRLHIQLVTLWDLHVSFVQFGWLDFCFVIACGGHLTATSRVKHFYSHAKLGGFDYDNNVDCNWVIEAEPGRNVQLTFLTFDVRIKKSSSLSLSSSLVMCSYLVCLLSLEIDTNFNLFSDWRWKKLFIWLCGSVQRLGRL